MQKDDKLYFLDPDVMFYRKLLYTWTKDYQMKNTTLVIKSNLTKHGSCAISLGTRQPVKFLMS